jgi:hypothetical protein
MLWQASAERFQVLVAVAVDLSSFVGSRTPPRVDIHATRARRDLIVTSLRPGAGGPPTYCCLSDHVNYKSRGCLKCLRCLVAIRSARHFQANNCYRSARHQQCRALRTNAESRERIPQDSNDGEIGSGAVGGASYLDRARARTFVCTWVEREWGLGGVQLGLTCMGVYVLADVHLYWCGKQPWRVATKSSRQIDGGDGEGGRGGGAGILGEYPVYLLPTAADSGLKRSEHSVDSGGQPLSPSLPLASPMADIQLSGH